MTDENTKDSESLGLAEFLKQEADSLDKVTRRTWIIGAMVGLFLIGYLYFALFMLQFFLNPKNAALMISTQVQENAPEFLFQTEQALRKKAPELAHEMSATFISSIPKLRFKAQEQIVTVYREMIPYLSLEFQRMIREYVAENSGLLRELVAEKDFDASASRFTAELVEQLGARLNETLEEDYGGRNLKYMNENLLTSIQAMDQHLAHLMEVDSAHLGRQELLQKQILALITRRLLEAVPALKAE